MNFFDAADRSALSLSLSQNDPFDADYFTAEGKRLYRVRTRKHTVGRGHLDEEVITVERVRTRTRSSSFSPSSSSSTPNADTFDNISRRSRQHRNSGRRASSLASVLDTIEEDVGVCTDEGSTSEDRAGETGVWVATIERRPFSLSPAVLKFNGGELYANKFLQRSRPFSSTRCFRSLTGDKMKWHLSTPTPKLYDSNRNRIAKYCRPFLPGKDGLGFNSKTAILQIAEGVESDRVLDEIIVTLLLTFLL